MDPIPRVKGASSGMILLNENNEDYHQTKTISNNNENNIVENNIKNNSVKNNNNNNNPAPQLNALENFCVAGVAGVLSKTVSAPMERVKLLIQNQDEMLKQVGSMKSWQFVKIERDLK